METAKAQFWGFPHPGALGRYYQISITKSISNIFKPNFCVFFLTNEIYKTYQTGFAFRCLGHALGAEGSKIKISEHSHVAYQIKKG